MEVGVIALDYVALNGHAYWMNPNHYLGLRIAHITPSLAFVGGIFGYGHKNAFRPY
jgi:hypothetical protein